MARAPGVPCPPFVLSLSSHSSLQSHPLTRATLKWEVEERGDLRSPGQGGRAGEGPWTWGSLERGGSETRVGVCPLPPARTSYWPLAACRVSGCGQCPGHGSPPLCEDEVGTRRQGTVRESGDSALGHLASVGELGCGGDPLVSPLGSEGKLPFQRSSETALTERSAFSLHVSCVVQAGINRVCLVL